MKEILWKIERRVRKSLIARSRDPRPASYPLITGDGFRALADHVYESGRENPGGKGRSFEPAAVREGEVVFVEAELLDEYFAEVHPRIPSPYKLITHNGDRNIGERELALIDGKIIRWFAQNVLVRHPKLTPIPIGLESLHYANAGLPRFFKKKRGAGPRNGRIYVNFNEASNPAERIPCREALAGNPLADIAGRVSQPRFVRTVRRYSAIASPRGNGEDCIRTWEAMLLGVVPIVQRSAGIDHFKGLGLPLRIVDSWEDLAGLSEYQLKAECDLIVAQARTEPLYMDYWRSLIASS